MRWGSLCLRERGRTSPDSYSSWVELVESVRWFVGQSYSLFKWMREWVSFSTVTAWNMVQQWSEQNVLFCNSSIYTCSEAPPAPTTPLHSLTILNLCSSLSLGYSPSLLFIFLSPPGWEYPRCTPVIGRFNVWTPSFHDPCVRPEKWNKVIERPAVAWKTNFSFEYFIVHDFIQTFAVESDLSFFGSNWLCPTLQLHTACTCAVIIPSLAYNQCVCVFDVLQGHLQAPGLEEWEYTCSSPQSPGLFPQAPWPQVSPFPLSGFMFTTKKRNCSLTEAHLGMEYWVERDVEQPLLSLGLFVYVCLQKIMSSSSSPGGIIVLTARTGREVETWWAAVNAGGLIPPMWHSKPISAWQGMALWRCTWALHL